ncbi:hypothetical protein ABIF38_008883 [Bradyrhizobium japonicum]|jgi:hypothetical protein|uniref:hypothetical protein n=1 Tax=Bradyrhizobium TaxID=374 RepID=UPI001144BB4F|nr:MULTISPECIES: hypothetical protein [Bradyrhizobium]MCP1929304.1 hypothetical protein [Bradyrhizobium elkanii]MCS3473377.1 hypothetical protein [Bradyrhizobium elkanii]MCS3572923.1 hypothetical protein [Bradyrhizobium elkanii]MCS3580084.1 hypothetical protein [Bradyrhizobium elkanii]MCS3594384.1 hypothetical protein [Bradyrhizobium elkanii]
MILEEKDLSALLLPARRKAMDFSPSASRGGKIFQRPQALIHQHYGLRRSAIVVARHGKLPPQRHEELPLLG